MRQIPHVLTVLRLMAAPVLAWLILRARFREALALVLLAGLTDWLDGFTARLLKVTGNLGVILDPLADKVLLVTLFFALTALSLIPVWLLILVVARDLVILGGALLLRIVRNIRQFSPSTLGKVSTFFQIVFVLLVLLHTSFPYQLLLWLQITALALTSFFTALSGLDYVRQGIQMASGRQLPFR